MKIGILNGDNKGYLTKFGIEKGFAMMKDHGFDCLDFQGFVNTESAFNQLNDAEFEKQLRYIGKCAKESGIEISQTHGPWRTPIRDFTKEDREERFLKMARAIRGTRALGCENFVVHNIMPYGEKDEDKDKVIDINHDFFGRLLRVAEENEVCICLENMPFLNQCLAKPEDMLNLVKSFDSPLMRMCLDTGHAALFGISCADAVRKIGKEYLKALHVHDNEGARDQHLFPGEGVIDWKDFFSALKEIDFEGCVSLETFPNENEGLEEKLLYQANILLSMI